MVSCLQCRKIFATRYPTIKEGKKTAAEITSRFDLTGATVSYHLSTLKKAGLIAETKYKKYIFYELNISVFEEVLIWIKGLGGNFIQANCCTQTKHVLTNQNIRYFSYLLFGHRLHKLLCLWHKPNLAH